MEPIDIIASFSEDQIVDLYVWNIAEAAKKKEPYGGSVPYADPGFIDDTKRYPIDCKHVKAALSYINQHKNASRYTPEQLAHIKSKIHAAFKRCFGHEAPSA